MNDQQTRELNSAGEALKKLSKDFNDWSSILTSHSLQAAYAIIAANWAIHGSTQSLLDNWLAKLSMVVVMFYLGANLLATQFMVKMHHNQYLYADKDSDRWKKEFEENERFWPYTEGIEYLGVCMRYCKVWLPIIATVLLIFSIYFGS